MWKTKKKFDFSNLCLVIRIFFFLTSLETKIKNNQRRQQNIEQVDINKKEKNKPISTRSLIIEIENTLTLNF